MVKKIADAVAIENVRKAKREYAKKSYVPVVKPVKPVKSVAVKQVKPVAEKPLDVNNNMIDLLKKKKKDIRDKNKIIKNLKNELNPQITMPFC